MESRDDFGLLRQTFDLFLDAGDNNTFEPSFSGSCMDCRANNMSTLPVSFSSDLHDSLIVHEKGY